MNGNSRLQKHRRLRGALALVALALTGSGFAQVPVDDDGNPFAMDVDPLDNGVTVENPVIGEKGLIPSDELETLVGPIALYPDDLLAIVLPASTYPLEIVQAARFLDQVEADPSLKPDEDWDDSIVALLNYPDVLRMMNEDIDWTWKLGEAIVSQQADVILAIESFRDRAYAAGNLKSDEHQVVSMDEGIIEIEPVDDDVIYVPYYEPSRVVTYSATPVYHYYPRPYPVYYYPYSYDHYFARRPFWGVTTAFTIGWRSHSLHVFHPTYVGHPYYGYNYIGTFWRRPSINIYNSYYADHHSYTYYQRSRRGDNWRPRYRSGARPRQRTIQSGYSRDLDRRSVVNTSRDRRYRDQRTDGLDYRTRPRSTTPSVRGGGSRDATRSRNRTRDTRAGNDNERPAIEFQPRNRDGLQARTSRAVNDALARRDANANGNRRNGDVVRRNEARDPGARNTRRAAPERPRVNRSAVETNRRNTVTNNRSSNSGSSNSRSSNSRPSPNRTLRQSAAPQRRQATAPRNSQRQSTAPQRRQATSPRSTQRPSTAAQRRPSSTPRQSAPRPAANSGNRRSTSSAPRRAPRAGSNNGRRSGERARRDPN